MNSRLVVLAIVMLITAAWLSSEQVSAQADKKDAAKPVESDMHEFMEYVFEPTYRRLKPAIATARPTTKAGRPSKPIR